MNVQRHRQRRKLNRNWSKRPRSMPSSEIYRIIRVSTSVQPGAVETETRKDAHEQHNHHQNASGRGLTRLEDRDSGGVGETLKASNANKRGMQKGAREDRKNGKFSSHGVDDRGNLVFTAPAQPEKDSTCFQCGRLPCEHPEIHSWYCRSPGADWSEPC